MLSAPPTKNGISLALTMIGYSDWLSPPYTLDPTVSSVKNYNFNLKTCVLLNLNVNLLEKNSYNLLCMKFLIFMIC